MPRNLEAGNEYFNNPGVPGSNLLPPERRSIPPQRARPAPPAVMQFPLAVLFERPGTELAEQWPDHKGMRLCASACPAGSDPHR